MTISLGPVFGGPGFSPWATCRYFGVSDDKSDRLMRADLTGHNLEEFCGALGRWDGHMMVSRCVSMQKTRTKKVHLCWFNLYRFSSKGTTHSIVQYTTHALLDLIIYLNFLEFNAPLHVLAGAGWRCSPWWYYNWCREQARLLDCCLAVPQHWWPKNKNWQVYMANSWNIDRHP